MSKENKPTGKNIIRHPDAMKMESPPRKRSVLLLTDDYTPLDYVSSVLVRDFKKGAEEAQSIAGQLRQDGWVIAGTFPYEVAETKVAKVIADAQAAEHPLRADLWPL